MNRNLLYINLNRRACYIISVCLLLSLWSYSVKANIEIPRGYLVTKNGVKLTGTISEVFGENQILFVNDFGTPYKIHAALIYGFVVPRQGKNVFYASKFSGTKWHFMELLHKGEGMNLYSAPIISVQNIISTRYRGSRQEFIQSDAFFVEIKDRLPVQISKSNFKNSMRKLLKKEAPELAQKIGSKGFRFKNLRNIILQYNEIVQKSLISL